MTHRHAHSCFIVAPLLVSVGKSWRTTAPLLATAIQAPVCPRRRSLIRCYERPRSGRRTHQPSLEWLVVDRGHAAAAPPPPAPPRPYLAYSNSGNAFSASLVAPGSISLPPSNFNCPAGMATLCRSIPRKPPTPTIA